MPESISEYESYYKEKARTYDPKTRQVYLTDDRYSSIVSYINKGRKQPKKIRQEKPIPE